MAERANFGGTDGVRALAGFGPEFSPDLITPELAAYYTYALVSMQIEAGLDGSIVIGRDTRPSGPSLEAAAIGGALAAGAPEVFRMGVAATPTVFRTAEILGTSAGLMSTASHNDFGDNGLKGSFGSHKPNSQQSKELSDRMWALHDSRLYIPINTGPYYEQPRLRENYIRSVVDDIQEQFGHERPLQDKIFVIDAANGAAGDTTPEVFRQLGAEVIEYACGDGRQINDGTGATDLNGLKEFLSNNEHIVKDRNFVGALAHDGDADRVIGLGARIGNNGTMEFHELNGNHFMELYAEGQPGIVGTDYTNDAIIERLQKQGIDFEFCRNGDVKVTAALLARQANGEDWKKGGEFTGHHVDTDWLSSGDGVRTAAWIAALATHTKGVNFADLAKTMPLYPEVMRKFKVGKGLAERAMSDQMVLDTITEAGKLLAEETDGRLLVRASGTEPGIIRAWAIGKKKTPIIRQLRTVKKAIDHTLTLAA